MQRLDHDGREGLSRNRSIRFPVLRSRRTRIENWLAELAKDSDVGFDCRAVANSLYLRSTNSMMLPSGSLTMAIYLPGKTCVSGMTNSTPLSWSTEHTPLRLRISKLS